MTRRSRPFAKSVRPGGEASVTELVRLSTSGAGTEAVGALGALDKLRDADGLRPAGLAPAASTPAPAPLTGTPWPRSRRSTLSSRAPGPSAAPREKTRTLRSPAFWRRGLGCAQSRAPAPPSSQAPPSRCARARPFQPRPRCHLPPRRPRCPPSPIVRFVRGRACFVRALLESTVCLGMSRTRFVRSRK